MPDEEDYNGPQSIADMEGIYLFDRERKGEERQTVSDLMAESEMGDREVRYYHRLRRYELLGHYYQHRRNDIRVFDFDTGDVIGMHQQLHQDNEPWIPICIHKNVKGNLKHDFSEKFDDDNKPRVGDERVIWIEAINEKTIVKQKKARAVVNLAVRTTFH